MASIYEFDWRYNPTEQVLSAISGGLNEVETKVVPVDIDEALEQWESLLGIAFVMAQTYITGIRYPTPRVVNGAERGKARN